MSESKFKGNFFMIFFSFPQDIEQLRKKDKCCMSIYAFFSLLSGIIIFSLGNYVIYKNKKGPINIIFMLFCILAGYLSYAESMLRQAADIETAYFWHKMMAIWPFSSLFFFILF